jgi:hypothetical protein
MQKIKMQGEGLSACWQHENASFQAFEPSKALNHRISLNDASFKTRQLQQLTILSPAHLTRLCHPCKRIQVIKRREQDFHPHNDPVLGRLFPKGGI